MLLLSRIKRIKSEPDMIYSTDFLYISMTRRGLLMVSWLSVYVATGDWLWGCLKVLFLHCAILGCLRRKLTIVRMENHGKILGRQSKNGGPRSHCKTSTDDRFGALAAKDSPRQNIWQWQKLKTKFSQCGCCYDFKPSEYNMKWQRPAWHFFKCVFF